MAPQVHTNGKDPKRNKFNVSASSFTFFFYFKLHLIQYFYFLHLNFFILFYLWFWGLNPVPERQNYHPATHSAPLLLKMAVLIFWGFKGPNHPKPYSACPWQEDTGVSPPAPGLLAAMLPAMITDCSPLELRALDEMLSLISWPGLCEGYKE